MDFFISGNKSSVKITKRLQTIEKSCLEKTKKLKNYNYCLANRSLFPVSLLSEVLYNISEGGNHSEQEIGTAVNSAVKCLHSRYTAVSMPVKFTLSYNNPHIGSLYRNRIPINFSLYLFNIL